MEIEKAVEYCENHECNECVIHTQNLDTRTKEEWENGVLCCENLTRYDEEGILSGKVKKWCDMCHVQYDCDDKDEFINSDSDSCPYYA